MSMYDNPTRLPEPHKYRLSLLKLCVGVPFIKMLMASAVATHRAFARLIFISVVALGGNLSVVSCLKCGGEAGWL